MYRHILKPLADFLISLALVLLLSPVIILTSLLLCVTNRGGPFFLQPRPGQNGRIFHVIKFKTMDERRDAKGHLLPDADRLTRMGRFLRKTSLDELPQLLNVLKGDMSLIGPRPLLVEYLPLYNSEQARRHEVRPGITGWAQVNGRNAIGWEEKFALDIYYVNHLCFGLDMKIAWMTFVNVIQGKGISQDGHATMEKFKGTS